MASSHAMELAIAYGDLVLYDFSVGKSDRFVHMGHWDDPENVVPTPAGLVDAQDRMNQILLELLDTRDGMELLDIGCGLGGSLEVIDRTLHDVSLFGVNIDADQLRVASQLSPRPGNSLEWIRADACALPVSDCSVDRVLCIEALPHFGSRDRFFQEVGRVVRPGGRVAVADILIAPDAGDVVGLSPGRLADLLDHHLGPWPEPYASVDEVDQHARRAGLRVHQRMDATANTAPTLLLAFDDDPKSTPGYDEFLEVVDLFQRIHASGALSYWYTAYSA